MRRVPATAKSAASALMPIFTQSSLGQLRDADNSNDALEALAASKWRPWSRYAMAPSKLKVIFLSSFSPLLECSTRRHVGDLKTHGVINPH